MTSPELTGKLVTVVGGARSGRAAARLLARHGARVFLTDRGDPADGVKAALDEAGIRYEFGGHTARAAEAEFLVLSPGVPSTASLVQQAVQRGVPVYSEIEVASWFCRSPIIAITGSNGKTTTTSLVADIFKRAEQPYLVAGNIGYPLADYVDDTTPGQTVILEVSSFQLDHIDRFRPRISVILNITPDHLDRYPSFTEYAQSKFRIFENQTEGDALIYGYDDEFVRDHVHRNAAEKAVRVLGFSSEHELDEGAFRRGDALILRLNRHEESFMNAEDLALQGRHNLRNSLAAALASRVHEIQSDPIRESLMQFQGVPHRMEFVRELDGVRYVNDSKATNVNSVWFALESFQQPIVLIAGGRDKGNDYSTLRRLVRSKVRALIGIGESGMKVLKELGPEVPDRVRVNTMAEAIEHARQMAEPGDVVLLSPACASFDMFDNFEHRGDTFKRLVQNL